VSDSPALHSKWLLLLQIEISLVVNFCFITNHNELTFKLQLQDLSVKVYDGHQVMAKGHLAFKGQRSVQN
jgi:hypothetical protein